MFRLLIFILIFFTEISAYAQASFPAHSGDSPWSFTAVAKPSDTFVVNDTDSSTIDQVLFAKDGSIYIDVPIRRYVGKTDANGYLLNANSLISNGIVSEKVTILMPVFDVDDEPFINDFFDCDSDGIVDDMLTREVDEVFLNGKKIWVLKGESNAWNLNAFSIDIRKIKFPSVPGETAINHFRIDIDVANQDVVLSSGAVGCGTGWSTSIDWIGIVYQAASPIVFVHGITAADNDSFANFQAELDNQYLASDATIQLFDLPTPEPIPAGCPDTPYNRSIDFNARLLKQKIPQIAQLYGTDSIHLVTHSKGGLDSRGFLSLIAGSPLEIPLGTMGGVPVKSNLKALSLITLNTPHQGAVLAAYGVEARQLTQKQIKEKGFNLIAAALYEGAYYCDLTPARASAFIASTKLPDGIQTASVATDADQDGDLKITAINLQGNDESAGYPAGVPLGTYVANLLYQLTGSVANVKVSVSDTGEITVNPIETLSFQLNDTIVTQTSAGLYSTYPITGWNHLNVHSAQNAKTIAKDALQESGAGMVNWRLR